MASALHAIVLEWRACQHAMDNLVPGSGKGHQHQAAGPHERVAGQVLAGMGQTA